MKSKIVWATMSCLMVLALLLASCGGGVAEEEEEEEEIVAEEEEEIVAEEEEEEEEYENWWDEFGEPQYGGTLTIRMDVLHDNFDPWYGMNTQNDVYENLFMIDWTADRDLFAYKLQQLPGEDLWAGLLAEGWSWTDPSTLVVNLRQGIHWQDKPPTNGREFTSDDVVFHYDRSRGTGHGFTEPSPFQSGWLALIENVEATDRYTVVFEFSSPSFLNNWWTVSDWAPGNQIEPPEVVEADITDWRNAAGTGAFMVSDFVTGSSLTLKKNPNYWRFDERHPENRLPYVDELKVMLIPDLATALAGLRTGKVDYVEGMPLMQAQSLAATNTELVLLAKPDNGFSLDIAITNEPFTDIRVRKALQMAVNLDDIADSYYDGMVSGTPIGIITPASTGWVLPYDEWPGELKAEYSYNPEGAMALLDDAGLTADPATGVRFETNIVASSANDLDLLQVVKSYFSDIGVEMTINVMEPSAASATVFGGMYDQMAYNIFAGMCWPIGICMFCRSPGFPGNRVSDDTFGGYHQQFLNAPDLATAQEAVINADQYALEQHWAVNLTQNAVFDVAQPYLKGWMGENMVGWGHIWYWTRVWIDQDLKESMGR